MMLDSPIFIAIVLPFAFAILQTLMNGLSVSEARDGERKFRVWYRTEDDKYTTETPLNLRKLQSKLSGEEQRVSDVDELPTGFFETSFGIDLCVGAISTDLVNILVLTSLPQNDLTLTVVRLASLTIVAEFIVAIVIATFLRQGPGHDKPQLRVLVIQTTNFAGLLAMFLSFFILGRLLYG